MNKKYRKMLATGLALNMMLINIPYNVFANSDMIENIILNEDNIPLIGEQSKSNLDNSVIKDKQALNDENLIVEESGSNYIKDEATSELLEPATEENYSNITEFDVEKNMLNGITDFTEDKKIIKSTTFNVINYADSFAGGDGSQEHPYQISNTRELARLSYLVNEENLDTTDMYFKLVSDIDLSDFDVDNNKDNGNWVSIGTEESRFKGIFLGNECTISNITIKECTNAGIFGVVENAVIKNLNIENCNIINMKICDKTNRETAGILVAKVYDTIIVNKINGKNNSITVTSAESNFVTLGGLIGYINHDKYQSYEYVDIQGIKLDINMNLNIYKGYSVGGLIGSSYVDDIILENIDVDFNIEGMIEGSSDYISYNKEIGGLVGSCTILNQPNEIELTKSSGIENISINLNISKIDNELEFKNMSIGGLISYFIVNHRDNNAVPLKNIDVNLNNDIKFTCLKYSPLLAYAGFLALDMENIDVKSTSNIRATHYNAGIIGDCFYSSVKAKNIFVNMESLESDFYCGGFVGQFSGTKDFYVDNFNYKGKLISNVDTFSWGGIIGYSYSTNNFTLLNSNVDVTIESPNYDYCGAIAGRLDVYNSAVVKNNTLKIKANGSEWGAGGLLGYSNVQNGASVDISTNEIYVDINSTYETVPSGGLVGNFYNNGVVKITDNFVIGNINNSQSDTVGYAFGKIANNGELDFSNIYFALNLNREAIEDKDTYLYHNMTGNEILYSNIYYDSMISVLPDSLINSLATEQMQGLNAKENMPFDYDSIWKLNKEYYPTFNQLNTAPELSGSDIELIQNQEYNLLDYVTVEDFEDKDLVPKVTTNLDITKIGNYTATFTVTDPQGLTNELTLNIKVVAESPIINAKDLTLYVGDKFNALNKVTAIDINGNDITEHIKVIENTVDTTKKGEYKVVYQVDSLERLTTTKEIKITVLEKEVNNNSNNSDNKVEDNKNESSTIDKPQTGDNFMVYGIALLTSLVGLLYIKISKKKISHINKK